MIASLLISLIAQSVVPSGPAPSIGVEISPPANAAAVTESEGFFNCRLTADDGKALAFGIRNGGGRGYVDPTTGEVKKTLKKVEISGAGAALLRSYKFREFNDLRYVGQADASDASLGKSVRLELLRTDDPTKNESNRYAILLQAQWDWMPLTKAVGFCDLTLKPQSPLTAEEARRLLNQ